MWFKFMTLVHLCAAFPLKCPEHSEWTLRANGHCADPSKYFCLWNDLIKEYSENCTRSYFQQPGWKAVLRGGIDAVICSIERYQPFPLIFYSNVSTNCIFLKSFCNEEGQVLYDQGNRNTDVTCRCDYRQHYDFLVKPNNPCYCKPSQEECSCYLTSCSNSSQILSPDYKCISKTDLHPVTQCRAIVDENDNNGRRYDIEKNNSNEDKISALDIVSWKRYPAIVLLSFTGCIVIVVLLVLFINRLWRYCFIVRFTSEFKRIYCSEGEILQLRLSVWSADIHVEWLKDDNKLKQNEDISIGSEGKSHCLTVQNAKLSDAGQYTMVAGNLQKHITVTVKGMFTSEFNPVHCIEGEKLQLQCSVYSDDIHVEWLKDDKKMDQNEDLSIECEGKNHCLTVQHAKLSDAGQYTMVAGNVLKYITVTVEAMLSSDFNPILCIEGEKLQLKCSVYSNDIDVEWLKDDKIIEQNDNTSIENEGRYHCMTVHHAKLSDAGQYFIVAENVQKQITVTVQAMFTSEFNPIDCIEGEKFQLKCSVYSEDVYVEWLKDNMKIKQNENVSIESNRLYHYMTILDAKLWDAGQYTMVAGNVQKHIAVTVKEMFESVCNQIYCNEGEKLQLKCTVCSEVIHVEWLFEDKKKIFQNEDTIIESDGRHHCLTFRKANLSNDGQYIMVAGNIQKRIKVTVKDRKKLKEALDESFLSQRKAIFNWKLLKESITPVNIIDYLISEAFVEKDLWDQIKRHSRRYQLNSILSNAIKNIQTFDDYDKFQAIIVKCYPSIKLQTPNDDRVHPPNDNLIPVGRHTEKHIGANRELLEKELYPKDYIDGFLEWFILSLEDHEALRNKEHLRKKMAHSFLETILQPDCIRKKSVKCLLDSFRRDDNTILNRISQLMNSVLPNGNSTFNVDTELQQHMQMRDNCRHFVYSKWSHLKENFNPPNIVEELHSCGLVDEDRADIIREKPRREMVNSTLRNIVRRIDRPEMLEKLLSVLKKANVFFCEELQDIVALKPLARQKEYDVEEVKCHLQLVEKQLEQQFDLNYVDTFLEHNVFDIDDHEVIWEAASGKKGKCFFEMISDIKYIKRGSIDCLVFCLNNSKYREKIRKELAELLLSEQKPEQGKDTTQMHVRPRKEAIHSMNTSSFTEGKLKLTVDNKEAKDKLEDEIFKVAKSPEYVDKEINGLKLKLKDTERSSVVFLLKSDDGNVKLIVEKGIVNGNLTSFIWNLLDDHDIKMHMSLEKKYNISVTLHSKDHQKESYTDPKMRIIKANRELLEEEYDPLLLLNAVFEENVKKYKSVENLSPDSLAVIKQQFSEINNEPERRERVKQFLNIAEEMIDADILWELIDETANAFSVKKMRDDLYDLNSGPEDLVSVEDGLVFEGNYEVWITEEDTLSFKELKGSAEYHCQHLKEVHPSKEIHLPVITNAKETLVAKDKTPKKYDTQFAKPSDIDDDQKRWLVIGICVHGVLSQALRKYVDSVLAVFHNELVRNYKIDTQIYPKHLQRDPQTGVFLNYEAVNNNRAKYGENYAKYDYTIKDEVDLSKLFLKTHMAHYIGFDETCDSSALLGLIINIAKFDPIIKSDADDVRKNIRNPWTHCDFTDWDDMKYSYSFNLMKKLVNDLKLSLNEEQLIIEDMEKWEMNGQRFLSGTTHCLEFRQQTHVLAVYATLVATETDDNFMRIKNELQKFEIIFDKIAQLDKDTKQGFFEIDKKLMGQDKTPKKHDTRIEKLGENVSKCACHYSHNVDIEFWKDLDVLFVETAVVKGISQILESKHSVLIIGEPGIGKSMIMHHIALKLHYKNEYSIIPCSGIQDILYHYKEDMRQMFVIDDICGRFTISFGDIEYLLKNEDTLKRILEKGKIKIAATCRLDIYSNEIFHASCTVFTPNIFNLSAELTKEDKLTICTKYLTETNIQLLKDQNEPFTPLMCYLYSKNENLNLTNFCQYPYETYRNEWNKLQSIDPYKYCALFLCVVYNGIIRESFFDINYENININQNVFNNICGICGINQGTSISRMRRALDGIVGTYLRKTKNEYRVIHDKMFDFMCYYFGNKDTLVRSMLRYVNLEVFNERTQLESINDQYGKFTIIISRKYEQDYFERIKNEILLGKLNHCFCNAQMKHEKYRTLFLKVLKLKDIDQLIEHPIIQDNVITSCFRGYNDIVQYLISKDVDLDKGYSHFTPLTAACWTRNEKVAQLLIDKGGDVNKVDGMKRTPLTAACWTRNEKIAQLLIDKGSDVNKVDGMRETPLTAAINNGNEKILQLLIDKGSDVNQVDGMRDTPLTAAINSGNEKIVQLLIDKGSDVNQVDGMRETPLKAAVYSGNEKILQLLIDKGSDVNQVDGMKRTLLAAAINSENDKILQLLIDKGSDVNQVDGMGRTLLTAAINSGNEKIVQLLIDKGSDVNQVEGIRTPLTAACWTQHEKIAKLLIDKGGDVNQVDGMRETPLIAAINIGNEKIVQLLIDKESDVNQVEGMKRTPLTAACFTGHGKIAQLLIDKGGDVNQVNSMRETPLIAAIDSGNEKIVQLLIDKGSDVNQVDGMRETPLIAAINSGNEKIVQILIDKGSDVNQVEGMRRTPLTAACWTRHEKIAQLLIDKGGDVNQVDGMRETPLIVACKRRNEMIVHLLIDNGCDVNKVDGKGETPLTAARRNRNENIVQLLIDKGCDVNKVDEKQSKQKGK